MRKIPKIFGISNMLLRKLSNHFIFNMNAKSFQGKSQTGWMLTQIYLSQRDITRQNMVQWKAIKLFHWKFAFLSKPAVNETGIFSFYFCGPVHKENPLALRSLHIAGHKISHLIIIASGSVKVKENRKQMLTEFLWRDNNTGSKFSRRV